jgi:uncharacterized membrane protein YfcA
MYDLSFGNDHNISYRTSLFNITIISLISLFLQITINQNVDFVLAVILIVSSSFGAAIASRIVEKA